MVSVIVTTEIPDFMVKSGAIPTNQAQSGLVGIPAIFDLPEGAAHRMCNLEQLRNESTTSTKNVLYDTKSKTITMNGMEFMVGTKVSFIKNTNGEGQDRLTATISRILVLRQLNTDFAKNFARKNQVVGGNLVVFIYEPTTSTQKMAL